HDKLRRQRLDAPELAHLLVLDRHDDVEVAGQGRELSLQGRGVPHHDEQVALDLVELEFDLPGQDADGPGQPRLILGNEDQGEVEGRCGESQDLARDRGCDIQEIGQHGYPTPTYVGKNTREGSCTVFHILPRSGEADVETINPSLRGKSA